jgi:hypothetical protein
MQAENQPAEIMPMDAMPVNPPPPAEEMPPSPRVWPPPSTVPHHSTEIRDWGINE